MKKRADIMFGRCMAVICAVFAANVAHPASLSAQDIVVSDMGRADINALETGEKLLLRDQSGPLAFAGHAIELTNFEGIAGYASEVAYIVTISGSASVDGLTASPGKMLLLSPYGAQPVVERYDALRFAEAWDETTQQTAPDSYQRLLALADGQDDGIFWGRLGRTNFNVAASGLASQELARRTMVGGPAIRDLRFASDGDATDLESNAIARFVAAMRGGNSAEVAEFLDPRPFGGPDLRGGAITAREIYAADLVSEQDWARLMNDTPVKTPDGWLAGSAIIDTVVLNDFIYVAAVQTAGE